MNQADELEALRRLKARYFRTLDTKRWDEFADVFTEDATLTFDTAISTLDRDGKPAPTMVGRAAIKEHVSANLATACTVHHGHMPEIDLLSETEAKGVWAMEDIVDHGHYVVHGFGHYNETYRKEADGQWRIASVHLTRIRYTQTIRDEIRL